MEPPSLLRSSSSEVLVGELDMVCDEIDDERLLAGCVNRTRNRMDVILLSTVGGASPPASAADVAFCRQTLPVTVHKLFRRRIFPDSMPAARCGTFFGEVLQFCAKLLRSFDADELLDLVLLLLGVQVGLPPYLSAREALVTMTTTGPAAPPPPPSVSFYRYGKPSSIVVAAKPVVFWPDDHSPIERAGLAIVGREVKRRFRRYTRNAMAGWFPGHIESYDARYNRFRIAFEDGDCGDYDLRQSPDTIVCPYRMAYDADGALQFDDVDTGRRIQVWMSAERRWECGWIRRYLNSNKTHVIEFDGPRGLVPVSLEGSMLYRLMKDLPPLPASSSDAAERESSSSPSSSPSSASTRFAVRPDLTGCKPADLAEMPSFHLVDNMNAFGAAGGYELLLSRIVPGATPFELARRLIAAVAAGHRAFRAETLRTLANELAARSFALAQALSDDAMRSLSRPLLQQTVTGPVRRMLCAVEERVPVRPLRPGDPPRQSCVEQIERFEVCRFLGLLTHTHTVCCPRLWLWLLLIFFDQSCVSHIFPVPLLLTPPKALHDAQANSVQAA